MCKDAPAAIETLWMAIPSAPTTEAPTTEAPITSAPVTSSPTTQSPTTDSATTSVPTTAAPTTDSPTTAAPVTKSPYKGEKIDTNSQAMKDAEIEFKNAWTTFKATANKTPYQHRKWG